MLDKRLYEFYRGISRLRVAARTLRTMLPLRRNTFAGAARDGEAERQRRIGFNVGSY